MSNSDFEFNPTQWTDHVWKIIDAYFQDNPQILVRHHIDSYNDFFKNGIYQVFQQNNPIKLTANPNQDNTEYNLMCNLYMGGRDGSNLYFGKPVIHDDGRSHYMYPNEARLRNMTYSMTIHYDIEVEIIKVLEPGEEPEIIRDADFEQSGGKPNRKYEDSDTDTDSSSESDDEEDPTKMKKVEEVKHMSSGKAPKLKGGAPKKKGIKPADYTPAQMKNVMEMTEKSIEILPDGRRIQRHFISIEKVFLGKFPIMVQSEFCVLNGLSPEVRFQMGECKNDYGAYFIIDGKEKFIIPQEKFADNMLYIRKYGDDKDDIASEAMMEERSDEKHLYSAEIKSVSENVSKPVRTLSVRVMAPNSKVSNHNIVVNIPNVRSPVPLFIVFRALGFISDKEIISMCLLDLDKNADLLDYFVPSVHEAGGIMSRNAAMRYIAVLTKGKTFVHVHHILTDYFLPHVGEMNYVQKAYYLGYMVNRLVRVWAGIDAPINRDSFKFKRIETSGALIADLFRESYKYQVKNMWLKLDKQKNLSLTLYSNINGMILLMKNSEHGAFMQRDLEDLFKKAFKGNWGAYAHTKRIGVLQDMSRLSFLSTLNNLRKTTLHLDAGLKLVGPRLLHPSQWGFFDPIDSPDGGDVGLHKHITFGTYITKSMSREPVIQWLREKVNMRILEECTPKVLAHMTKVFVNGLWAGVISEPFETVEKIKIYRRNALLPIYISVYFDIPQNTVYIYCDGGRLCRPIFYFDKTTNKFSYESPKIQKLLNDKDSHISWQDLISGFQQKKIENFSVDDMRIYELAELYGETGIGNEKNPAKIERFNKDKAILDYVDTSESEGMLICMNPGVLRDNKTVKYTHMEIHESFCFSMMCNLTNFMENNPANRNNFSCGQSKQAVSMYHTNHQVRMDKAAVVLDCGQTPLVKSRYLEYINHEGNPYGENAIVAIMCYTGYNVEDAILVNEGAVKRGLFRTTYYSTYETHEEKERAPDGKTIKEIAFGNIEHMILNGQQINGKRVGYEYDKLDDYGLVREGTEVHDKLALIGMTSAVSGLPNDRFDESKTPKKGQLGIVDKTFITEGDIGQRIAKVRVREVRMPMHGDKMASRAGQKGTVGLIIPEEDMPFTKDGIKPDLIINPHAIPTRMTIGQLVECIAGKAAALYGGFAECTAYSNNTMASIQKYGEVLTALGYHSTGNEIMYSGYTGMQMDSIIFMGPTYYMRLKHMVKDKINYRTTGPRTKLTRQTVGGRANDGGLRIGEMERDAIIAHGATNMLTESMMERGDKYYMAVCNKTGMLAIYHPEKNLFYSPMADGPVQYIGSLNNPEEQMHIKNVSKYGRSFSIICVPYTFKLLLQELQCMNVSLRIITEDNIDQFENMKFSKNINKLMHGKIENISDVIQYNRNLLQSGHANEPVKMDRTPIESQKDSLSPEPKNAPESPPYATGSPAYPESPPYAPGSPAYGSPAYESQAYPESPPYAPGSPAYGSPAYGSQYPESPPYAQDSESQEQEFKTGELVMIRGTEPNAFTKQPTVWMVKAIGNGFVTLENQQPTPNAELIQVVEPSRIYRVPTTPSPPLSFPTPLEQKQKQMAEAMGLVSSPMQPIQQQPSVSFAPTIVVGNDNKTDITNPTGAQTPFMPTSAPASSASSTAATDISLLGNKEITIKKSEPKEETKEKEEKSGGDGGFFNFFKIKKLE